MDKEEVFKKALKKMGTNEEGFHFMVMFEDKEISNILKKNSFDHTDEEISILQEKREQYKNQGDGKNILTFLRNVNKLKD